MKPLRRSSGGIINISHKFNLKKKEINYFAIKGHEISCAHDQTHAGNRVQSSLQCY